MSVSQMTAPLDSIKRMPPEILRSQCGRPILFSQLCTSFLGGVIMRCMQEGTLSCVSRGGCLL